MSNGDVPIVAFARRAKAAVLDRILERSVISGVVALAAGGAALFGYNTFKVSQPQLGATPIVVLVGGTIIEVYLFMWVGLMLAPGLGFRGTPLMSAVWNKDTSNLWLKAKSSMKTALMAGAVSILISVVYIFGVFVASNTKLVGLQVPSLNGTSVFLYAGLTAGLAEEAIFRVGILAIVTRVFRALPGSTIVGYFLSTLIWASTHNGFAYGPPLAEERAIQLFLVGLVYCIVYIKRGYEAAFVAHLLTDTANGLILSSLITSG